MASLLVLIGQLAGSKNLVESNLGFTLWPACWSEVFSKWLGNIEKINKTHKPTGPKMAEGLAPAEPKRQAVPKHNAVPEPPLPPTWKTNDDKTHDDETWWSSTSQWWSSTSTSQPNDEWSWWYTSHDNWESQASSSSWKDKVEEQPAQKRYKSAGQQKRLKNRRNEAVKQVTEKWQDCYEKYSEQKELTQDLAEELAEATSKNTELAQSLEEDKPAKDQCQRLVHMIHERDAKIEDLGKKLQMVRDQAYKKEVELANENSTLRSQLISLEGLRKQQVNMFQQRLADLGQMLEKNKRE